MQFVSMFYGAPSQYLWEDDSGTVHTIDQGEGGEQGDASMPLLCSLGQHGALQKLHSEELREEETLLAFLDDTHVVVRVWIGRQQSAQHCRRQCSAQQAFASTQGKRRSGTPQGETVWMCCRDIRPHSGGVERIRVAHTPTRVERVGHDEEQSATNVSWTGSPFWKTCKLLGCCWSIVQLHEPTA